MAATAHVYACIEPFEVHPGDGEDAPLQTCSFEFELDSGVDLFRLQLLSLLPSLSDRDYRLYVDSPAASAGSCVELDEDSWNTAVGAALAEHGGSCSFGVIDVTAHRWLGASCIQRDAIAPAEVDTVLDSCSAAFFADLPVLQPSCTPTASPSHPVCIACARTCFPPGAFLSPPSPDTFACRCGSIPGHDCLFMERYAAELGDVSDATSQAARVHARLAIMARDSSGGAATPQAVLAAGVVSHAASSAAMQSMAQRIMGAAAHVRAYDDEATLAKARRVTPIVTLLQRACEEGGDARFALLHQLVLWFKRDFFKWVNTVMCSGCGGGTTASGGAAPTAAERANGAGMCEIHTCNTCGVRNRFPRFNAPQHLLETRAGRCGEWANAFTCVALAWGYDARHCTDWSDHVWTEVWSRSRCRWLHVDACEAAVDSPLMYESGWGKKLSYIIAAARTNVADVTRGYTKRWLEVAARRTGVPDTWLASFVTAASSAQLAAAPHVHSGTYAFEQARANVCEREMQACIAWDDGVRKEEESAGRISGSLAWRAARHETGAGDAAATASGGSSAPRTISHVLRWNAVHEGGARGVVCMTAWGAHILACTEVHTLTWRPAPMDAVDVSNEEAVKRARWRGISLDTSAASVIIAVAAVQRSQRFLALCKRADAVGVSLACVQPVDGSKAWSVIPLHAAPLPTASTDSGAAPSALHSIVCVRDCVYVLAAGALWLSSASTTSLLPGATSAATRAEWVRVCSAPRVRALACVGSCVFGYAAAATDAGQGHIVLLTAFLPTRHAPLVQTCSASHTSTGVLAPVRVRTPACVHPAEPLVVDVSPPAAANHWMCLHTYGQLPQSGIRHAVDLFTSMRADGDWSRVVWPARALPSTSGLYSIAYFGGVGYGSIVGTCDLPLVVPLAGDMHAWTCVCPASNVVAFTGAGSDRLLAVTAAGDVWSLLLPALLCSTDTDAEGTVDDSCWTARVPAHASVLAALVPAGAPSAQ